MKYKADKSNKRCNASRFHHFKRLFRKNFFNSNGFVNFAKPWANHIVHGFKKIPNSSLKSSRSSYPIMELP